VAVDDVGVASVVLNLTAVGAVPKLGLPPPVGVIVTLVPTAPLVGVNVGTSGQVPAGPVVKLKVAESPDVLCTRTVVAVLTVSPPGSPTSAWVSASTLTNVPATAAAGGCWNVTDVMGPPFAASWKFVPVSVAWHPGLGEVGRIAVMVGTAA
jgi:hypothetical protein